MIWGYHYFRKHPFDHLPKIKINEYQNGALPPQKARLVVKNVTCFGMIFGLFLFLNVLIESWFGWNAWTVKNILSTHLKELQLQNFKVQTKYQLGNSTSKTYPQVITFCPRFWDTEVKKFGGIDEVFTSKKVAFSLHPGLTDSPGKMMVGRQSFPIGRSYVTLRFGKIDWNKNPKKSSGNGGLIVSELPWDSNPSKKSPTKQIQEASRIP